jgi:hypothetical protein
MMSKTPPSDEALQEITDAAAAALTSPGESVIAIAVWALIEGPEGPTSARGQWAIYPTGISEAIFRQLRIDIDRILKEEQ